MSACLRWAVLLFTAVSLAPAASAQTAPAPAGAPIVTPEQFPPRGWPDPVEDRKPHTLARADVLDFTPNGGDSELFWDFEGWHGGDFNRLWFKSEGEQSVTKSERNIGVQVMYGRFIKKFYDVQFGGGVQTATFEGRNVTRGQAVVGLEGFVPYKYDLETLLFISQDGDVEGRVTFVREYLITQRLIVQPRFESTIAAQRVEEFTVGTGLNNIELGARFRFEFRRDFGPYVGFSYDRRLFDTADLVRAEGEHSGQLRFVIGLRAWR